MAEKEIGRGKKTLTGGPTRVGALILLHRETPTQGLQRVGDTSQRRSGIPASETFLFLHSCSTCCFFS